MMQKQIFIFIWAIFSLVACKIDRKQAVDRDKFTFKMGSDTKLFFENVRQIYYDFTDMPVAHTKVYRLSDRYKGQDRPMIFPTIVMDWNKLEAYLLIEMNDILIDEPMLSIEEKTSKGVTYAYRLQERGRENMLEFATKIYEGIMADNEVYIQVKGEFVPLFISEDDKENFRIVMGDYYRLTNVF